MRHETSQLQQARRQWLEQGQSMAAALDGRLAQSWLRSSQAGVDPQDTRDVPDPMSGSRLSDVLDSNVELLAHAKPVMDFLYHQIRGSRSMVVLADAHSMVLHTQGDRGFLNKAQRVALSQGACWKENSRGTNAIGTALFERMPVRVRGGEHFMAQNAFLHCAAAPIFTAQGAIAGVIDISGEPMASHSHSLGMANMAARMIENSWLKAAYPQHARIHLHPRVEGLGSAAEGILIMRDDGCLIGANQAAMHMLRLSSSDFSSTILQERLQHRLQVHLHNRAPAEVAALRLPGGQRLFFCVHSGHTQLFAASLADGMETPATVAGSSTEAVPSPAVQADASKPQTEAALQPADALAQLDTGDAQWRAVVAKVRRIVHSNVPLLIQGESGTGKEVLARAAHDSGPRRNKPFVAINCAAIPESLIESELFGYAPGAYTGALRAGSLGRIREADGGTLFLDEIGDMPLALQTRLLRVLQERTVSPLGGDSVKVDFAVISATHCRLQDAVAQGRFRADLFYRINGFNVQLPALRERSDWPALWQRLLASHQAPEGTQLAPDLEAAMQRYDWPGNIRQLANTVQTACALLQGDERVIDWPHVADDMRMALQKSESHWSPVERRYHAAAQAQAQGGDEDLLFGAAASPARPIKQQTQQAIAAAMLAFNGNVSQVARQLGVSRQTIYRYLRPTKSAG
ncbi:sigma-54-dependent Fis family transcriptional regulator [Lampropedia aestuarii]|uniref:Sigma-54-dependent Fis family transcriptional regulator n=1 Tax=Lampropedia aestuarii TaxID=2562762 RepID=A0A4S5BPC1_9BURK|nr:sigma-54-dependent Fis family transcriptional regulator [Lampropedia aestuarii]THJ31446.1 sigma-54-dependent Fis family transcriptional regulator [Lampropedia aestuarii]